jgi:hypothetical protein
MGRDAGGVAVAEAGAAGRRTPVIVFPGLATGDFSTFLLRGFLRNHGYDTYGWDLGLNFGHAPAC